MPSSTVTSLLLPDFQSGLVASVAGADATATTYVLNCAQTTDSSECGIYNVSVTLGPWASKTLPPGAASTGNFDLFITVPYEDDPWEFSVHCPMTRSVAKACTTTNIGGNDDGHPVATLTDSQDLNDGGYGTLSWADVTITAGQDLLTATHAASATGDASGSSQGASGATATGSSSTPTAIKDSGAASCVARIFTAMSVAGVAMSIVLS